MRTLSRIECFTVDCTNEASVTVNGDHVCIECARADLANDVHKHLLAGGPEAFIASADTEIAAAKAAGKCGDCYACCGGYHEQCKGPDHDWGNADVDAEVDKRLVAIGPEYYVCAVTGADKMSVYKTVDACGTCMAFVMINGAGHKISVLLTRDESIRLQNQLNDFIINGDKPAASGLPVGCKSTADY